MAGTRAQAERDAITVEIVFAVVTGAVLAALLFLAVASPALFGDGGHHWITSASAVAGLGFCFRVVRVLRRFPRANRGG